MTQSDLVHTGQFNQFRVRVFSNRDNLRYEIEDLTQEKVVSKGPIPIGDKPLEVFIKQLRENRETIVLHKGTSLQPCFPYRFNDWELPDNRVSLIQQTKLSKLKWSVCIKKTKMNSLLSVANSTIPSPRCHPTTVNRIEEIIKKNDVTRLRRDFKPTRILEKEFIEEKHDELRKIKKEREEVFQTYSDVMNPDKLFNKPVLGISVAVAETSGVILAAGGVGSVATTTSAYVGGGILGSMAGGYVGLGMVMLAGGAAALLPVSVFGVYRAYKYWAGSDKQKDLEDQTRHFPLDKSLVVEIEPISCASLVDERVCVSQFTWAVTLITGPTGVSKNHAWIIVEGLADNFVERLANKVFQRKPSVGEYFMHKSEFNPPVNTDFLAKKDYLEAVSEGIQRTEIWMKPADEVRKMLEAIEEQRGKRVEFAQCGKDSIISKGHNCFTWAREKLGMIDIDLGKSTVGFVVTIPRTFTQPLAYYKKRPVTVQI